MKSHILLKECHRRYRLRVRPYGRILQKQMYSVIDRNVDRDKLMVNVGGGWYFRRHWKVMDFPSEHYRFVGGVVDYRHNLASFDCFPFADNSVAFFYSSHTLEHIPQEYCQHVLDEMHRCLRCGGAVRLALPDFDLALEAFRRNNPDFFVKYPGSCIEERFLNFFATWWMSKIPPSEFRAEFNSMSPEEAADFYTTRIPRDSQKQATANHINWWNYDKLNRMLAKAGFCQVYRSNPQGSQFPDLRGVGWDGGFDSTHPELSLYVEAIK